MYRRRSESTSYRDSNIRTNDRSCRIVEALIRPYFLAEPLRNRRWGDCRRFLAGGLYAEWDAMHTYNVNMEKPQNATQASIIFNGERVYCKSIGSTTLSLGVSMERRSWGV